MFRKSYKLKEKLNFIKPIKDTNTKNIIRKYLVVGFITSMVEQKSLHLVCFWIVNKLQSPCNNGMSLFFKSPETNVPFISWSPLCTEHAYLPVELTGPPCTFSIHWLLLHFCRSSLVSPNTNRWQLCLINNQASCSELIISQQAQNSLIIKGTYIERFSSGQLAICVLMRVRKEFGDVGSSLYFISDSYVLGKVILSCSVWKDRDYE